MADSTLPTPRPSIWSRIQRIDRVVLAILIVLAVLAVVDAPQVWPLGPPAGISVVLTRVIAVLLRHTRGPHGVRSYAAPNLGSRQQLVAIAGPIGLLKAAGETARSVQQRNSHGATQMRVGSPFL